MRFVKQWALTTWWALAVCGWIASSKLGLEHAAGPVGRQIVFLMPAWGAPWAVPLALIRAVNVPGGLPYSFETALVLGLATCVLLDLRRRGRSVLAPRMA